jgi:fructokinase
MLGGIEAGGTKFVCGVGSGPGDLRTTQFPTTLPDETIAQAIAFFRREASEVQAVGIGSFGPVDLDERSPTFGSITSTPKTGWANVNIAGAIAAALGVPVVLDTDTNSALLGEARWGAAKGLAEAVYVTVGTGIGGGAMVHGEIVHGLMHLEIGHLRLPHDLSRDPFPGCCPFHGDCLEGLACGPAIAARWRKPASELGTGHEAWALEAHYLALGLVNLTLTLSPRRILIGGGVMQQAHLFDLVRAEFAQLMNGYIKRPEVIEELESYIAPPGLKGRAGILGALVLAEQALAARDRRSHMEHSETRGVRA